MKRKRILEALLAAILVLSLAACGETQDISAKEESGNVEMQTKEQIEESESQVTANTENTEAVIAKVNSTVNIEETVLVDQDDIKIIATELNYTDYSVDLNLVIENNSSKNLSFISGSMGYCCNAVNGYMVDSGYVNVDVAAGKKANESVSFSMDELAVYGITEISDIQIGFEIKDDSYNSIYSGPRQVRTSVADSYDYVTDTFGEAIDSGALEMVCNCTIDYYAKNELYNHNGIRIISEVLMTNADSEKVILLEIVNESSELVYVTTRDISVNGLVFFSSTWSGDFVNPGARRIMTLSLASMFDKEYWEAFGISDIGDFTCSVVINDPDYTEIAAPQEIGFIISDSIASVNTDGTELYNEQGIRIISKGLFEDPFEYSNDIHMLFLIENNYADAISIDDSYGSFSINGFMADCIASKQIISSGKYAVLDVEILESFLDKNGITSIEDIAEAEIVFEIKDSGRKLIAEPTVSITY